MLKLHRMNYFNEFVRCHASGEILMWGDFYYTDDNGKIISAKYYHNMKEQEKRENFDQSILENAQSQKEYQEELRLAEQEYLTEKMMEEPLETKDAYNWKLEENSNG